MIYEYAIDPACLPKWCRERNLYGYFLEKFGLGTGRLMARFPKSWRKMVREAFSIQQFDDPETANMFLEELAKKLMDNNVKRPNAHPYTADLTWLQNAHVEHERKPFKAILSYEQHESADVLNPETLMGSQSKKWNVEHDCVPLRTKAALSAALSPLLGISNHIIFIDPHFDPGARRYINAFKGYFELIVNYNELSPIVEIITQNKFDDDYFNTQCLQKLKNITPLQLKVTVKRYSQKENGPKLHNRFILTDVGGIKLGAGLDIPGSDVDDDDLSIMGFGAYTKRWQDYVTNPVFDCNPDVIEIL